MFFEPPSTIEATPFPAGKDDLIPTPRTLNRAARRQLNRQSPIRKALRAQDRPMRRAFAGVYTTRDRLALALVAEANR